MAKASPREPRRFDQTYLSAKTHGRQVHRDYAAHWFRWGFAKGRCYGKDVLDVGCGPEWPLGKVLTCHGGYGSKRPARYVGVDLSRIQGDHSRNKILDLRSEFDFVGRWGELGQFHVVTCFEVLEHMDEADQRRLLAGIRGCLLPEGTALISTPVRQGGHQARNHVREVTVDEMRGLLEGADLAVESRFGTYGDVPKLLKASREHPWRRRTLDDLADYYSNDVLACFLAPLYPDHCKNNLWVCVPR